jgi:activating signal cointegrator complex subunit 3
MYCVEVEYEFELFASVTGDYTPDLRALLAADIIICTPEKWDGISRAWQSRSYVKKVALVVIDEVRNNE